MNKKNDLKIAKQLHRSSLTKGGMDEAKIRRNIENVKTKYKRGALGILSAYLGLLSNYIKNSTLIIESPDKLHPQHIKKIAKHFEIKYDRKLEVETRENENLFGGLKISLGDNQWDFSLKGRINQFKEALHG
jgi:F0F1-type ATP synthase delta subunit